MKALAAGSLGSSLPASDEQPALNEDKAPVPADGRWAKPLLKLVSQNNTQTNTQINAKCLNCQENSAIYHTYEEVGSVSVTAA